MANCNCNRAPDACTCGDPGYNNHVCIDPVSAACVMIQGDFTCLGLSGSIITLQDFATAMNAWKCNELCNCAIPVGLGVVFSAAGQSSGLYGVTATWLPASGALSYTFEYKHATDTDFTVVGNQTGTMNNSLILPVGDYIFRVRSICQTCASDYAYYDITVDPCASPTSLSYNQATKRLSWSYAPNTDVSKFVFSTGGPAINVPVTESPIGSGTYIANLTDLAFAADTLMEFYLLAECSAHIGSGYATGCASACVVPNQSAPTVGSITGTTATLSWPLVEGVTGYTVSVNGSTPVFVGNVNTYPLSGLTPLTAYTATVGYKCSNTSGCSGKSVSFTSAQSCSCPLPTGFAVTFDGRGLAENTYKARTVWQPVQGTAPVTYDFFYKLSSAPGWTLVANQALTSNSGLLLSSPNSYDFKVLAHCGTCSSQEVILANQLLVACTAPTNASWDAVNKKLVWNNTPGQPLSSFEIQIRRDDSASFTTQANIAITESPAGTYTADLSAFPFTADYIYHFCVSNVCGSTGNVISDHGSGCAFDCVVPNQSVPTVSNITETGARVSWDAIPGISSYTVTVDNGTAINVGNVLFYDMSQLSSGSAHTVKIGYVCGSGSSCNGKSATFNTLVHQYVCPAPSGLTATNINVPSSLVRVYYGTGTVPTTIGQITGSAHFVDITSGSDIPLNFSMFNVPDYMWMAQPRTEPLKTFTYDGQFQEAIAANQSFQPPSIVSTMEVYSSQNQILIQSNPYTFKKS